LLKILMNGAADPRKLSGTEAALLARWAAKTAYLHNWATVGEARVPREHLRALEGDGGKPVTGVSVYATQAKFEQPSSYLVAPVWPQAKRTDEIPADAYKIVIQFRHLYLLVAFWPNRKSIFLVLKRLHIRLWPAEERDGDYDAEVIVIPPGPVSRSLAFGNALAILHL
jgi:hypothetical protein